MRVIWLCVSVIRADEVRVVSEQRAQRVRLCQVNYACLAGRQSEVVHCMPELFVHVAPRCASRDSTGLWPANRRVEITEKRYTLNAARIAP